MSIESKMAVRNLWRNPRRSILTICAVAFAAMLLVFMLSFQFGSYASMINFSVRIHTGDLQVQAKGYQEKKSIRQVVPHPEKVGKVVGENPRVTAYTYRANAFSLVSSKERTYGVLVIGIDPDREATVSTLKTITRKGKYLKKGDYQGALVGAILAQNLQVGLGDELTILGQGRDGSIAATAVTVAGIYKSGQDDFDRSTLQITLANFDETYSMRGAVHEVVALTKSLEDVSEAENELEPLVKNLGGKHPLVVLDWDQLLPGLKQAIEMDLFSGLIFYLILVIVVAFSILNTFLMAVLERTREFGVLMAVGCSKGRLTRLLLYESTAMTLIGVGLGMALGAAVTFYFQKYGIPMQSDALMSQFGLPSRIFPMLCLPSLLIGPGAILGITFLTALYPAFKVRRLQPVEAMTAI